MDRRPATAAATTGILAAVALAAAVPARLTVQADGDVHLELARETAAD